MHAHCTQCTKIIKLLSLAHAKEKIEFLDQAVDLAFSPIRSNKLTNRFMYAVSESANHSILWNLIMWTRVLPLKKSAKEALLVSIGLLVESGLVNGPIKMVFRRERPERLSQDSYDHKLHKLRQPRTSSFPSGHATSAMCATIFFANSSKNKAHIGFFGLLALLVGLSRVHVKIHHASDVLGGAFVGFIVGKILKKILFR